MGAVYQAWDQELGVAVALKVIRPEATADPAAAADMERRFKRELLLARQVTHTNVVRIHDLGELKGIKYITMPYVQGEDLATCLKRDGKLPVERRVDDCAAGRARARRRARRRRRPPRPQAGQHHDRRRRARAHHGLRHRPLGRTGQHGRGAGHRVVIRLRPSVSLRPTATRAPSTSPDARSIHPPRRLGEGATIGTSPGAAVTAAEGATVASPSRAVLAPSALATARAERHRRDAGLHGARAGARPSGRSARRHLRVRHDPVGDAHRPPPARRRG